MEAAQSNSGIAVILQKLDRLSEEVKEVNRSLTDRIDTLENELERKLTEKLLDKMAQSIDRRVNNEMNKIHKSLDERIDTLRADITNELDTLSSRVNSMTDVLQTDQICDRSLNLVFRKVPETVNENIVDKINTIIKDHMHVNDVKASSAKRLPVRGNDPMIPGIVVATFTDKEQRSKILKAKKQLNNSIFKQVFVHEDQSKEERLAAGNLRAMVNAVNRGQHLSIRGNRVYTNQVNRVQTVAPTMVQIVLTMVPIIMAQILNPALVVQDRQVNEVEHRRTKRRLQKKFNVAFDKAVACHRFFLICLLTI
ncbi:hypothetical protein DPMN_020206 [Dreissena polymorpha]|uniref:Uncharacterized protein n=1 Tax=Dreissena polymorpha TaxID=45954 RepID=A0A9D4NKM1_DREPO|nr:hypothetical protein DPMN_020206 [Dreissena polymorpha]